MPLTLRYVARSDVGLVREGNEDSGYAGPRVLVVADGMGGHVAGEVASAATVEEIVRLEGSVQAAGPGDTEQPDQAEAGPAQEAATREAAPAAKAAQDALAAAVHGANDRIRSLVEEDPRREGMGTTVTAALWTGEQLVLAHVGDSRAYLLRDGELSQVTHDHTFVQSLVDEGRITEDEAGVHPARSLLLRALTGSGEVEPDLVVVDVRAGDRVLLCSDGLSGVVRFATIGEVLAGSESLEEAADRLVELALKGGAPDNVTCVVADLVEQSDPPSSVQRDPVLVGAAAGPTERRSDTGRLDRVAPAAVGARERGERTITDDDDPEALRYAPRPPRRFVWLRRLAVLAVVGAILYVGLRLASSWVGEQYYVGDEDGDVAVFQGLSQEVGPVRLSELYEVADGLPVEALPSIYQEQVAESIAADDLGDARRIVTRLRREACAAHPPVTPEPTVPPAPAVTPDPAGTPLPTAAPAPEPGVATAPEPTPVAPAPTPTPSPTPTPGFPGLDCEEVNR